MKFIDILCKRSVPQLKQSRSRRTRTAATPAWVRSDPRSLRTGQRLWNTPALVAKPCRRASRARCRGSWSRCCSPSVSPRIPETSDRRRQKLENLSDRSDSGVLFHLCCLFPVKCVNGVPAYFAELLHKSMKVNMQLVSSSPGPA